jgi:hypothetical protein
LWLSVVNTALAFFSGTTSSALSTRTSCQ